MNERITRLHCIDRRVKKELHRMTKVPKLSYRVAELVMRYEKRDYKILKSQMRRKRR